MAITIENAIAELRRAVPSVGVDPEWEAESLQYPIFNDLARLICSEAEVLQYADSDEERSNLSKVRDCMIFLGRALGDGDSRVQDLVRECVESLAECTWRDQIRPRAGPHTAQLWRR